MEDSYLSILKEVGEDPNRAGLKDTPKRAANAMRFLTQGYSMNIEEVINGALFPSSSDEMVIVKNIELYSMCEHQKYFHVVDKKQGLIANFITVSNIDSTQPEVVISGNERVIRPRLADAAFFFETDKKYSLAQLRERLKSIVFQKQLGTVFDKTERIASLSEGLATALDADASAAKLAGQLSKADLASDMVLEFDKMQGTAGGYYARHEGLGETVANAIAEHYLSLIHI